MLAGEQLLEIGLAAVNVREEHRAVRRRVAGWLEAALGSGTARLACPGQTQQESRRDALLHYLPVTERAKAGAVLARLGDERKGVGVEKGVPEIDWIEIPPGKFKMGNDKGQTPYEDESPQFDCDVIKQSFAISRYPVTVAQYQAFVDAGGYGEKRFWTDAGWKWKQSEKVAGPEDYDPAFQTPNHPRVGVNWFESLAFSRWLNECGRDALPRVLAEQQLGPTKLNVTLPSEAEWERAARHTDGQKFPWGNQDEAPQRCNANETGLGHTSTVGMFLNGNAICGAADMAGNVWEWTRSLWGRHPFGEPDFKYPYRLDDKRENLDAWADVSRILRGGSWFNNAGFARCADRNGDWPGLRHEVIGFRLVASPIFCAEL